MIRYLPHHEIDFEKWDAAVDAAPEGLVYAKSWYLNIVAPGWQALTEDDYATIFPLTSGKKYGLNYLYQPPFTQQLGIFSKTEISADLVQKFLLAIPNKFRLVEIQLNHLNEVRGDDFNVSKRITHLLDLNQTYESIQKKYSDSHKRKLKMAQQHALSVIPDFKTAELIQLFKSNRGKEVDTMKERHYHILEKLAEEADRRNLLIKIGVRSDGRLEAGAIFIQSNHEYIFLFSATGEKAKETGAMTFIIDHFIQSHAPSSMHLDFEGSVDPGLARFYKSFGSDEVVYLQIRKNNLPLLIRWLK
jgi:hypothetical protein